MPTRRWKIKEGHSGLESVGDGRASRVAVSQTVRAMIFFIFPEGEWESRLGMGGDSGKLEKQNYLDSLLPGSLPRLSTFLISFSISEKLTRLSITFR